MRMRRKKNLEKRIEDCSGYFFNFKENSNRDAREITQNQLIDFVELFGNENPVVLEIGCGKGRFANTLAKANPNINVLAVEKCDNVLITAAESAKKQDIKNIKFICCGAEYLQRYIPQNSIKTLYLNFSCPYPKKRYANHRLTSKSFLDIYKIILEKGAFIYQKTDNLKFFEYSLKSFSNNDFYINDISLDLHKSDIQGNIMTEYEEKFSSLGSPIYYLKTSLYKGE